MGENDYMCDTLLKHFLSILSERKDKYVRSIALSKEWLVEFDNLVDESEIESQRNLQSITLNRVIKETKILAGINASLLAINNKTYGYCIKTGAKIGIERLIAKPTETICRQSKQPLI